MLGASPDKQDVLYYAHLVDSGRIDISVLGD